VSDAATFERFISGPGVASQLGIPVDALYAASDRGEFARYYLFGSGQRQRKYYLPSEVAEAIKTLVPGDPTRWRRTVAAVDAAAPFQASRQRRATQRPARGSSAPAS
jgi:hypothetical protein